jgi:two-component system cell cycle response regulator CpdR
MARILIAEDDSSMRHFLKMALERAGHAVVSCPDGAAAYDRLAAEFAARESGFDLLLTDIVMPGMDGIELANKAGKLCPTMKIMFITGFAAVAREKTARLDDENPPKILAKPFHLKDLVDQVEQALAA